MDTLRDKSIWKNYGIVKIVLGKHGMIKNRKFWKNKKVLITGHTGFKESWLSVLLYVFGAKIYGYSLK